MTEGSPVRIDIWSDYVCPFCYLEEPVLSRLEQELVGMVEIRWRAFELRPVPVPTPDPKGLYLKTVWERAVYPMAAERGMNLRLPQVQPRSRKALEAAEFARGSGKFQEMHTEIFRAFFEHGEDIGDVTVLAQIALRAGLDPQELQKTLDAETYLPRVLEDERQALVLGISSVPTVVVAGHGESIDRGLRISGAEGYGVVRNAVETRLRRVKGQVTYLHVAKRG